MFQFSGFPSCDDWSSTSRVSPFGHLRINSRLHFPVAFRSLPRPSSSLRAKASSMRPYELPILCNYIHPKVYIMRRIALRFRKTSTCSSLELLPNALCIDSFTTILVNELFQISCRHNPTTQWRLCGWFVLNPSRAKWRKSTAESYPKADNFGFEPKSNSLWSQHHRLVFIKIK